MLIDAELTQLAPRLERRWFDIGVVRFPSTFDRNGLGKKMHKCTTELPQLVGFDHEQTENFEISGSPKPRAGASLLNGVVRPRCVHDHSSAHETFGFDS